MKVYEFICNAENGGGCAIVIAHSKEEAFGILSIEWTYGEFIRSYTNVSHCNELPMLEPSSDIILEDKPKVVTVNFYKE